MANHMECSRTHIATGSAIGWDVGRNTRVVCCCGQKLHTLQLGMLLSFYWEMKANHLIEYRPCICLAAAASTSINRFGHRKRRHDMDLFYNPGNNAG